jgi:hypothetical protein
MQMGLGSMLAFCGCAFREGAVLVSSTSQAGSGSTGVQWAYDLMMREQVALGLWELGYVRTACIFSYSSGFVSARATGRRTPQHRSAGAADLLIAATAERERVVILCDDRDYLGIAACHGAARQDHHRDPTERYRFLSLGGQVYLIEGLCRRENQERARDRTG